MINIDGFSARDNSWIQANVIGGLKEAAFVYGYGIMLPGWARGPALAGVFQNRSLKMCGGDY